MTIHHHISDELLLDYASGTLAEGWSLAVATHLALCPACRRRLKGMEAAAGMLLEALPNTTATVAGSDAASWEKMKARMQGDGPGVTVAAVAAKPNPPATSQAPLLPEPLRSYLGGDGADLKWRPLGRGAYHIPIRTKDGETSVRLLRIPAGKPVPEHSHGGRELTLVLAGSFHDEEGEFHRGDIEDADETLMHQPIANEGEDCICLAVTDAPLKFRSWLLRLVQPVLGI
ncbi:transcriptional regulator [Rhizobium sp. CG5]|uniref:ChrR family anti-sigma-E factor n=1 Tax=Rhizobium sp. CG5 TaxID=2726076 RepID=UPI0020346175|nr:ChrR family anti-sigma-E factor [Rhizobium sp. CG5]MCM2473525.1 transcriptional regulator [Rhizobium sp. CG5]